MPCALCNKPAIHHCARCATDYCSKVCQKKDWKKHKLVCAICTICLDKGAIQSGCACRGEAGLAHIACRAETAKMNPLNWRKCYTCLQEFTGPMQLGLAKTWWDSVQCLPESDPQWIAAADNIAATGPENAVHILQYIYTAQKNTYGLLHPKTLGAGNNLACAYNKKGLYNDAAELSTLICDRQKKVYGTHHINTCLTSNNLAYALDNLGRYAEAEKIYLDTLHILTEKYGHENVDTLLTSTNLAACYNDQGKYREAELIYRNVLVSRSRVLGPHHPSTFYTTNNLAIAVGNQGKRAEAFAIFSALIKLQQRVLGPDHPDTILVSENMMAVLMG